jgi:hypothetical protein
VRRELGPISWDAAATYRRAGIRLGHEAQVCPDQF